jgi:hypothetical protein
MKMWVFTPFEKAVVKLGSKSYAVSASICRLLRMLKTRASADTSPPFLTALEQQVGMRGGRECDAALSVRLVSPSPQKRQ